MVLFIILARTIDVSLSTIRTMLIVKGDKYKAVFIAFFEVLIWYYTIRFSININDSIHIIALSYAIGYALGTFIGLLLNDLVSNKVLIIHILSNSISFNDINNLNIKYYKLLETSIGTTIIINKKYYKLLYKKLISIDSKCLLLISDSQLINC